MEGGVFKVDVDVMETSQWLHLQGVVQLLGVEVAKLVGGSGGFERFWWLVVGG